MAKYYLNTQAQDEVGHQLHNEACPKLPSKDVLKYVGSYSNPEAAHYDMKMYFKPVTFCPDCLGH